MTPDTFRVTAQIQSIEVCANPQTLLTIAPHNIKEKVEAFIRGQPLKGG